MEMPIVIWFISAAAAAGEGMMVGGRAGSASIMSSSSSASVLLSPLALPPAPLSALSFGGRRKVALGASLLRAPRRVNDWEGARWM